MYFERGLVSGGSVFKLWPRLISPKALPEAGSGPGAVGGQSLSAR